jgi:hypothetical protein
MLPSQDSKEFKWIWLDEKMHTVNIEEDGEKVDIEELHRTASNLINDKEDLCKSIYFLGICLTGSSEAAWGFLYGYLVRSIKRDKPWTINHSEEETSPEERRNHLADQFEMLGKMIREGKMNDKVSTPNVGGDDGTDFFTKR